MPGPTLIQIKRSINTGTTPTLANGELAFTANGDILFIGSNAAVIPIGSKRTPGVLTANQGLVTNSTNMIDVIRIGNSTVNAVLNQANLILANATQNTAIRIPTAAEYAGSYYLKADGSWSTVTAGSALPAGANTNVQYNDSGVTGGVAAFTYDEATNTVFVSNSFAAGANTFLDTVKLGIGNTTANLTANSIIVSIANSTGISNQQPTQMVSGNTTTSTLVGIGVVRVGNSTINTVANSEFIRLANATVTFDVTKPTAAQNTAGNYFLGSNSLWQQITPPATNLDGLTDVTIATIANNDFLVYDNVAGQWENHPAGNGFAFAGQVPAIVGVQGTIVNTTGVHVLANNGIVANSTGTFANIGTTLAFTSGAIGVNTNLSITDLSLTGNLTVSGTLSTIDAVNLVVNDSIISLARNNGGNVLDIGMYGQYNDGSERFTGLIWDTTDSTYYLFSNTSTEPTTTLSIADANLRYSTLRTYLISNAFTSNATAVNITATGSTSSVLTINTLSVSGVSTLAAQIANSTGFVPTSNTVGQLLGNTISRWDILYTGGNANSTGLYPISNTAGRLFGNTISRWEITANTIVLAGQSANSSGLYPVSNTSGQLFGNSISRWDLFTTGQSTNSTGIYPISNTAGQAFGNTISRWEIVANTLALSTALTGASGGTGQTTSTARDVLVGAGGSTWNKLALGTAGLVLQSFGGALVYDTLDGGTF